MNGSVLNQMLIAAILIAGGCAAPESTGDASSSRVEQSMVQGRQQEFLRQFTNVENGLEIRRWVVPEDPDNLLRIGEALAQIARPSPLPPATIDLLRRNGLRLVAIPFDRLDALAAQLDPLALNLTEWHGQIVQWRALHERSVGADGRVVAIDGRVRRFDNGRFQLLARSWPVSMEDGAYLHLDLVPFFERARAQRAELLPRQGEHRGDLMETLSLRLQLEAGFAYVLTAEDPEVNWPGDETRTRDSASAESRSRRRGPAAGPVDARGPATGAPATLGMLLLSDRTQPPTRGMLILVPNIGRAQYPPLTG
jgi:hypothetical protein